ncbi:aspartate/glutamate racemase family protein [Vibrio pectenicida]|uniref:Aspartate/glutamate racemase family protein n=1 Tax=Vibrio pectenicida TaxID=62763 RepID=A0A7Y3ZZP4_9VIBR|nr:aspartate/glutamate racemase family protein [Vibrio pectenicida]NOH72015.1 aspartate/glutamate racemase family protein [Vibrio pectenicida]
MKTIGIIGGMSWESTSSYYKFINQAVNNEKGGLHSAKIILYSVDFAEIECLQKSEEWGKAAVILSQVAQSLENAGADFIIVATNTMHKVFDEIQEGVSTPLLHIADPTGQNIVDKGITKVGLIGTAFTMEQDFYKQRLKSKFGIEVIVPNGVQRRLVHDVIYDELCVGKISARSKQDFKTIIEDLTAEGAQGVILGCTEIGLLLDSSDIDIPVFDTTVIHAQATVREALYNK